MSPASADGKQLNGAQALIDLFTARAAKDLSLDLAMPASKKK